MTPADLHAAVLDALFAAGGAGADSVAAPWLVAHSPGPFSPTSVISDQDGRTLAYGMTWQHAHLVVALRNTASSAHRGARRIIERHHPDSGGRCGLCWGRRRADAVWPCPDYRDAALVIPHLPEEVARALTR